MLLCMRTTIRIDDHLFASLKQYAHANGKTLTDVIEDALREKLSRREPSQKRKPVKLTTVTGRGVRGGIDLDDSAELLEIMENSGGST